MRFLIALGQDVEITVGPATAMRAQSGQLTVANRD